MQGFELSSSPSETFSLLALAALSVYAVLGVGSYFVFFVWWRRRFHPGYTPPPGENRRAVLLSLANVIGGAALVCPMYLLVATGHTRVYFAVEERGVAWLLASALLLLFFVETLVYWIHRALHTPLLYRLLHRPHHAFRVPNALASFAFHPLDAFAQSLPIHVFALLVPTHIAVYLGFLSVTMVWTFLIHLRVPLVRWRGINNTSHHTVHHWFQKYNLGQFFTLWDRIGGTYRSPDALPAHLAPPADVQGDAQEALRVP
ncbi:sterol desaturase family protein [Polyangium aurulentum]|uniref:sterol desaturase family protein n=1 Tax=Polyangium aurulentum TaxID=2567896 RepID=UPI00146AF117|nr:sterol desaturase family protein [Polyangium aurulentum]UQA59226.1 sterol desaturase family protein [Polyangium aurulentum]